MAHATGQAAFAGTLLPPTERCVDPARRFLLRWLTGVRVARREAIELFAALSGVDLRHPLHDLDLIDFGFRAPARAFTGGRRINTYNASPPRTSSPELSGTIRGSLLLAVSEANSRASSPLEAHRDVPCFP